MASCRDETRYRIRAHAAAVDNIGLFFGEDIFIAIGSILLIRGFLDQNGIHVEPTQLAVWAIPTAICAFVIHGARLLLLDRSLTRDATAGGDRALDGRAAAGRSRLMITLEFVYMLMGLMLAGVAIVNLRDRASAKRYNNAAFWGLYADHVSRRLAPSEPAQRLARDRDGARHGDRQARRRAGGTHDARRTRGERGAVGQQAVHSRADDSRRHAARHIHAQARRR